MPGYQRRLSWLVSTDHADRQRRRYARLCTNSISITHVSPRTGKLPTCCQLSETIQATRHNRHNGFLPPPTCYGLVVFVAHLLYGPVTGKSPTVQLVTDLLRGNWCNGLYPLGRCDKWSVTLQVRGSIKSDVYSVTRTGVRCLLLGYYGRPITGRPIEDSWIVECQQN